MLKGGRFIWYYWAQGLGATLKEEDRSFVFTGAVRVFGHLKRNVIHQRTITKQRGQPVWQVKDEIMGGPKGVKLKQLWHLLPGTKNKVSITTKNEKGTQLEAREQDGWYSSLYGQKEKTKELVFSDDSLVAETIIKIEAGA